MMGDQTGLHSEAGRGTLFWFGLSLKKQNTDANPAGKTVQQALSSALLPPSPALPVVDEVVPLKLGGRVLVAGDNPVNQAVVGAMLESLGVDFSLTANGQIALDRVLHEAFDLVLIDYQMPEMDGFATTMEIRTRESEELLRARVPIVALTANAVAGDRERCLAAGIDDHLSKPFRREQLAATLQRWLPQAAPIFLALMIVQTTGMEVSLPRHRVAPPSGRHCVVIFSLSANVIEADASARSRRQRRTTSAYPLPAAVGRVCYCVGSSRRGQ
jgi:CheY-like chemotaxis protein